MQRDVQRGRFVVAARDLAANETVLETSAYVIAPLESYKKRVCSGCLAYNATGRLALVGCKRHMCDQVYYCSETCRERDAADHDELCALWRRLASHDADRHIKSLLRVLTLVLLRRHQEEEKEVVAQTGTAHIDAAGRPNTTVPVLDELSTNERGSWADFLRLQSHADSWTQEELREWRKTERFLAGALLPHMSAGGEPLQHYVSAIESNCFGAWTDKGETYGRALFLFASYFNHSCQPNCESIQHNGTMAIVTRGPIPKGTELTIRYIDVNIPCSTRRATLLAEYHFLCQCERCIAEAEAQVKPTYTYAKSVNNRRPPGSTTKRRAARKAAAAATASSSASPEEALEEAFEDR